MPVAAALATPLLVRAVAPRLFPFLAGLAGAMAAALVVLILGRYLARNRPVNAPRMEWIAIGAACTAGFLLLFQNVLVHDALWYYSYLRSALIGGNLDMYDEFVLRNPNGMYLPPPDTPVFHLGTALFEAPAALLVHPFAALLNRRGLLPGGDGYGPIEIGAATFTSMLLAVAGVALTHRLARRFAGGAASAIAVTSLLFASPLAFFAFVWPGYPHAASVFLGAAFLLVWLEKPCSDEPWRALLLGLLAGVLTLVHPQDILYLALPALDLVTGLRRDEWRGRSRSAGLLAAGAAAGFGPQLAAWTATSGRLLPHVYEEIGDPFRWSRPALWDVLFSGYNGLFIWTPLCAVGAAGLFLLRRDHPRSFRGLLAILLLQWWSIASYGYWWGGASFGARYFLSAWPVLAVGLAAALAAAASRAGMVIAGMATVPFVYWNLLLMAQFRLEWIAHNQPPRLGEIVQRQFEAAPAALASGLAGTHGWNRVLVLDQLVAALQAGSIRRLAVWLFALLVAAAIIILPVAALQRGGSIQRLATAILMCALFATAGVHAVSTGHNRRRLLEELPGPTCNVEAGSVRLLRLAAPPSGPSVDRPTATKTSLPLQPEEGEALSVDLISFLHNGERREEGEIVAWLGVRGPGCGSLTYSLRAGYETAETAPDRLEVRGFVRHDLSHATIIHSWWQDDASASHYWGHAYLASWQLPSTCLPDEIVVNASRGAGSLEIRRLAVSAKKVEP